MKENALIKEFEYRNYRISIFPQKVVFEPHRSDNRESLEKISDLLVCADSKKDTIEMITFQAKKIVDMYQWCRITALPEGKIMVRYTSESNHGWVWKIIKADESVHRGGLCSDVSAAVNAAVSFLGR